MPFMVLYPLFSSSSRGNLPQEPLVLPERYNLIARSVLLRERIHVQALWLLESPERHRALLVGRETIPCASVVADVSGEALEGDDGLDGLEEGGDKREEMRSCVYAGCASGLRV
jgi:hypothetical protein